MQWDQISQHHNMFHFSKCIPFVGILIISCLSTLFIIFLHILPTFSHYGCCSKISTLNFIVNIFLFLLRFASYNLEWNSEVFLFMHVIHIFSMLVDCHHHQTINIRLICVTVWHMDLSIDNWFSTLTLVNFEQNKPAWVMSDFYLFFPFIFNPYQWMQEKLSCVLVVWPLARECEKI